MVLQLLLWLTNKQPNRGYLLGGLATVQGWLQEKLSLNSRLKAAVRRVSKHEKAPRWVSEFYLAFALLIALLAFLFATPGSSYVLLLLTVVWPVYRILEFLLFLLGWVFVEELSVKLHSVQRSLLSFLLNMMELSLLFGTLDVSIGGSTPVAPRLDRFLQGLVSIATVDISKPIDPSVAGILELVRVFSSLLLVLVILGSLTGGILREAVKPGEGK